VTQPEKISALPAAATLDGTETIPLVQAGDTKKATPAQVVAAHAASATAHNGTYAPLLTLPFNVKSPPVGFTAAVGDGVADDTAAIQAALNACIGAGAISTVRACLRPIYFPPGTYKTTAPLTIKSVQGFQFLAAGKDVVTFNASGTLDSFLDIDGCANGVFGGFTVTGVSGIKDKVIALDWTDSVAIGRSTSGNSFRDVVVNGSFKYGFAMGTRSAGLQVDDTSFYNCLVTGARVSGGGADTTHSQDGFRLGSTTAGNVLGFSLFDCSAVSVKNGVSVRTTTAYVFKSQPASCDIDFFVSGSGSVLLVDGVRSEGATRLLETSGGAPLTKITFSAVTWHGGTLNADGYWVYLNGCAQLTMTNCAITSPAVTPQLFINGPGGTGATATFIDVQMATDISSIGFISAGAQVVFVNYVQTDASDIAVVITPLLVRKSGTEHFVVDTATSTTKAGGNLSCVTAGKGLRVAEGANAKQGVATLVAGTVTVSNTSVTATSRILLTVQSLGTVTAPKAIAVTARTAATSFVITSADATDTSVVAWEIFEPA
jgi:hypothetical protein